MKEQRIGIGIHGAAIAFIYCALAGCFASAFFADDSAQNEHELTSSMSRMTPVSKTEPQESDEREEAILRAEKNYQEKMQEFPSKDELAADWEKPDVALFITGRLHGYMEPCGCTGLDTQKGGLLRRFAARKVLEDKGWDIVMIDAGNQIQRFGQQPLIKIQKVYQALCQTMNYEVIGFGIDDFKLPTIDLIQSMMSAQTDENPFTCGNVTLFDDPTMSNSFRIIERSGKKIGVTCIIGDEHLPALKNQGDLTVIDMQSALTEIVPELQNADCDLHVLVAQTSLDNCRLLAEKFPNFGLLVTSGGAGDPTLMPEEIVAGNHTTRMIQVGVKGMYVGIVGLYTTGDGGAEIRYERVPLDYRFEPPIRETNEITEIFTAYQDELKAIYIGNNNQDIRPRQHPSGNTFVGSTKCMDCHDDEFAIWEEGIDGNDTGIGPHTLATTSLTEPGERTWVPRNFDPECLSCHVTGWNAQGYFPYISGYMDLEADVQLHANGCENCHGPGSAHVEAENNPNSISAGFANLDQDRNGGLGAQEFERVVAGNPEAFAAVDTDRNGFVSVDEYTQFQLGRLRNDMVLTVEQAKTEHCQSCHDLDNSPDFLQDGGFDEYWAKIKHGDGE